jgi:cyanophycin synthetase
MTIGSQFWRWFYRAQRFADVPAVIELLRFRELRRRYYDALWARAAAEIGARIETPQFGFTALSRDGSTTYVKQDRLMLDSSVMLNLLGNKAMTYEVLARKGCPVPAHVVFSLEQFDAAAAFLERSGGPVVVKPVAGTGGGNGVTTGIRDLAALRAAARHAARFDSKLLAEAEVAGHSYRLLYLEGRLVHAVRRDPPVVTGDGRRSIKALAAAETRRRLTGAPFTALSPLRIDQEARNTLAAQRLDARKVLAAGQTVTVKKAVNQNAAPQNHTVTADVHAETAAACAALVRDVGVQLAGIDIISPDISRPLGENGGLIGEINTTPGLHHHDLLADRPPVPSVAAQILDHMFRTGRGTMRLDRSFPHAQSKAPEHAA